MNDVLLSGKPTMDADGIVTFGKIDNASDKLIAQLKKYGADEETITSTSLVTLVSLEVSGEIIYKIR